MRHRYSFLYRFSSFRLVTIVLVLLPVTVWIYRTDWTDYDLTPKDGSTKLILTYTTLWTGDKWPQVFEKLRSPTCPYRCEYTEDKRQLYRADVVMFHGLSMDLLPASNLLLKPRPPKLYDQIWVFKVNEAPDSYPDTQLLPYPNVFNWTMTYRLDTDVAWPNAVLVPKNQSQSPFRLPKVNLDGETLRQKKLVFAMISNCNPDNHRLQYIALMQKYVKVDIYGKCGNLTTAPRVNPEKGYEALAPHYKFYLGFENSFCIDYVTEKAFHPLRYGIVPVVRGGADYSQRFPPGSYINTADFSTARELSRLLVLLDENDVLYRSYFKWRDELDIDEGRECETCTKIHTFNPATDRHSYSNIYDWYNTNYTGKHQCWKPKLPLD